MMNFRFFPGFLRHWSCWMALLLVCAAAVFLQQRKAVSGTASSPGSPKEAAADGISENLPASLNSPPAVSLPAPVFAEPEPLLSQRQDLRWRRPVPEPVFAAFQAWADRYVAAPDEGRRTQLAEGLRLVEERRREMADLIDQNPRRALELAVPAAVRRQLPDAVLAQLEEPVSGRGDLWVAAAVPMPGRELEVPSVQREVILSDGRRFAAFTFGRRESTPCRTNLPIHGVALDGKLALADLPGRVMEPVEIEAARKAQAQPAVCPTSGLPTADSPDEVVLDWDGTSHGFYCGPKHAEDMLLAAADLEAALPVAAAGGDAGGSGGTVGKSSYTEGTKKLLIIRVDFPDKTGQVVSDSTLTSLINNMSSHWNEMSFGKMTWATAGNGSAFTPTLRLPKGHASYTSLGTMLGAARAAAEDAGFKYTNYNFEVVVTGDKPDVGFGGVAYVGGRGAWLANGQWNLGVCSHEVGHNFGLNHSGFWDTSDGTMTGAGEAVEYGNPFDHMGGASSSTDAHFGARQKNYLDWIPDSSIKKLSGDGASTVRISACDRTAATGFRAIAIDRTNTTNDYWLEYRQTYADTNKYIKDGVVLNWGPYAIGNQKPILLDWTPGTSSKDDCPLLIGRTFTEAAQNLHLTPLGRGTDANGVAWIDVQVNRGAFAGNRKPTVFVSASTANPAVDATATFTATASDPDGDAVAYFWEWGDDTFTANNSASATHKYSSSGTKTVRCRITDMKGQTATGQLLVQVGSSSTFFIQGIARGADGLPLEGVKVSVTSTRSDTTDSEGYFAVTGIPAGSHFVSASKSGLTFQPSGFTNPVGVGPSRQNINFVAGPGTPVIAAMKPALVDQGSNSGAVILPVSDPDNAVTALTLTGSSSNTAIIPNSGITFGTVGTTVRTVTAAAPGGVSGAVDITITATDPSGESATLVWSVTVNAAPVLAAAAPPSTAENTPVDIDLRTLVTDDLTPADQLHYSISKVRNGSIALLSDGHTARFVPPPNYHGAASFALTVRDQSLSSRTFFLYDFEPPDTVSDGKITDASNFNRIATFELAGSGGEYAYPASAPPPLLPQGRQCLSLTENGGGAVRFRKTIATTDLNLNDADWSFSAWVLRNSRDTDDFILHLGDGDGFGSNKELQLYFAANTDILKLGKYGSGGLEKEISGPSLAPATWHHVALTYDRTASNTGTFSLYVDGFLHGSAASTAMDVSQSVSAYVGGTADNSASLNRWFDGKLDDVMLASSVLGTAEIWGLAHWGTRHELGLEASATVTVNVTGSNQPPAISPLSNLGILAGAGATPVSFLVSDPESEARTLTLSATSSNPTLLPPAGIIMGAAPAAWSNGDIGTVGAAGSTVEDHGTFILKGSGADIGGTTDEGRWMRQELTGDGEIIARIVSLDFTNPAAKAGVMMRESSTGNVPFAFAYVSAGQGVGVLHRATTGAAAVATTVNGIAAPCWLRLVRTGSTFSAFHAPDNSGTAGDWQEIGTPQDIVFSGTSNRIGLAVTSKVDATLTTAVFDRLGGTVKLGGERTLTVTPAAGQTGTATVSVNASDGSSTSTRQFLVTVAPNTPPVIAGAGNRNTNEGSPLTPVTLALSDIHTAADNLTISVRSSNQLLLPDRRITVSGTGAERILTFSPVPSETGQSAITVSVSDGVLTTESIFYVSIAPGDPAAFLRHGANWRFLAAASAPAGWTGLGFGDGNWLVGPGKLGYGEGDEETLVPAAPSRISTYFRRIFQVADPAAYPHLKLNLRRDDGAVVYLNGSEIHRSNLPPGPIGPTTLAPDVVTGTHEAEDAEEEVVILNPPLVAGANIFAVEVHQNSATSSDLSFDLSAHGTGPEPLSLIARGRPWRYLDTGTAPAVTWINPDFDDAAWKSGAGQLGFGDGDEATEISGGPDDARFPATWFRRRFTIADPARLPQLAVRYLRDDGILFFLNGQEIIRDNLPAGDITAATLAATAVGNADELKWTTVRLDPSLLRQGTNILTAQLHQSSLTSSDLSFDCELLAYPADALPEMVCACSGNTLTLSWPASGIAWRLAQSSDLTVWTPVTNVPVEVGGQKQVTLPRPAGRKYYRLEAP